MTYLNKKHLYFPILTLTVILIYQLIKTSLIIKNFPIHWFIDGTSYMAKLFFLAKYGFHSIVKHRTNNIFVLYNPPSFQLVILHFIRKNRKPQLHKINILVFGFFPKSSKFCQFLCLRKTANTRKLRITHTWICHTKIL